MVDRITENQKRFRESIERLLELYYLDEFQKQPDKWNWNRIGERLSRFFSTLYDKCYYDPKYRTFEITRQKSIVYINKKKFLSDRDIEITLDTEELLNFLEIMELLYSHTVKKEFVHFEINFISDQIDTVFSGTTSDGILNRGPFWEKFVSARVQKTTAMALKTQNSYSEGNLKEVGTSSFFHRTVSVRCLSDFAKKLLKIDPQENGYDAIPLVTDPECYSFYRIMRSVFVHFYMAFGNFERIKACSYCQRLFVEKRKGSGKFCSNNCRKENHKILEPEEKRKCRDRQNAWMKYKIHHDEKLKNNSNLYPYAVFKDDCEICTNYVKSGECLTLMKRNKLSLKILNAI